MSIRFHSPRCNTDLTKRTVCYKSGWNNCSFEAMLSQKEASCRKCCPVKQLVLRCEKFFGQENAKIDRNKFSPYDSQSKTVLDSVFRAVYSRFCLGGFLIHGKSGRNSDSHETPRAIILNPRFQRHTLTLSDVNVAFCAPVAMSQTISVFAPNDTTKSPSDAITSIRRLLEWLLARIWRGVPA